MTRRQGDKRNDKAMSRGERLFALLFSLSPFHLVFDFHAPLALFGCVAYYERFVATTIQLCDSYDKMACKGDEDCAGSGCADGGR